MFFLLQSNHYSCIWLIMILFTSSQIFLRIIMPWLAKFYYCVLRLYSTFIKQVLKIITNYFVKLLMNSESSARLGSITNWKWMNEWFKIFHFISTGSKKFISCSPNKKYIIRKCVKNWVRWSHFHKKVLPSPQQ